MKKKGWFVLFLVLVGSVVGSVEAFKWSELGRAPLMTDVQDKISLQEKFSSYRGDILEGLRMAEPTWNASEIFQLLETAIRSDRAAETFFGLGQRFEWMIFRPQGRVGIVRNVEWAGKGNLEGFLIAVAYKNEEIKFFIAKRCGNLALIEKKPAPPPTPKVETPPLPRVQAPPPSPLSIEPSPPSPPRVEVEDIFIRVFFLRLPDGKEREILEKDPRAMTREAWQVLNEITRKSGLSGKFLIKFHRTSVQELPTEVIPVEVRDGIGVIVLSKESLSEFREYSIWPEKELFKNYKFLWPPSGWQKGSVQEFLKSSVHHRVFITY
jgi:hypothetical protein